MIETRQDERPSCAPASAPREAGCAPAPVVSSAPRLRIAHIMLWTACTAAYLALPRQWGLTQRTGSVGGAHAGYSVYPCKDGRVSVAALEPHFAAVEAQFGPDSSEYEKVGGKRQSERKRRTSTKKPGGGTPSPTP